MVADKYFYLHELEDSSLDEILNLDISDLEDYINSLILNYYPKIEVGSQSYLSLVLAYKASFILEKVYRHTGILSDNFTAIYTKTGLIREIVSDLYAIDATKLSIN